MNRRLDNSRCTATITVIDWKAPDRTRGDRRTRDRHARAGFLIACEQTITEDLRGDAAMFSRLRSVLSALALVAALFGLEAVGVVVGAQVTTPPAPKVLDLRLDCDRFTLGNGLRVIVH